MTALPPSSSDSLIWDTWLSIHRLPVVTVADEIGLFAALPEGGLTTEALAGALGVDARALGVHLGALAATGFVTRQDGVWQATEAARTWLHPEAEGYYGPVLAFQAKIHPLHRQLLETLQTGQMASDHITSTDKWEAGTMSADAAARISMYMNIYGQAASRALAGQSCFAETRRLLDVGGGSGIFSIQLAQVWPALSATLLDLDAVCGVAAATIAAAGLTDRISTCSDNMFTQDWPVDHDTHLLSNVIHDWDEEGVQRLMQRSFHALPPGGRIVLHEMLVDDDGCGPLHSVLFSLVMLLGSRGRQYSFAELREMLTEAGFVRVEAGETGHGCFSIVTAEKP